MTFRHPSRFLDQSLVAPGCGECSKAGRSAERGGRYGIRAAHLRRRVRRHRGILRAVVAQLGPAPGSRQRPHAGNLAGHPAGGVGLPGAPVPDHRHRGHRPAGRHLPAARARHRGRLPGRRAAVRGLRLHRHERVSACQRAHGAGGRDGARPGAQRRLPRRRDHGHARRRPGPAGGGAVLLAPRAALRPCADPARGHPAARGPRVRRVADLDLRAPGRRHLHEGRGRRRRPRGQGRGRHSGGRSAQSRRHRRQRGRQRGRLRRHGGRSVRDVRRYPRRHDAAGGPRHPGHGRHGRRVSAAAGRRVDHRVHRRLLAREEPSGPQDHVRAVHGAVVVGRTVADRLRRRHVARVAGRRDALAHAGLRRRRHRPDGPDGLHHRVLHGDGIQSRAPHRASIDDGPRHQHHRGTRRVDEVDGVSRARRVRRHPRRVPAGRPVRHRHRGDGHAVDGRHHRRAGCVRPHHGQRGRHRGDERHARRGARRHRPAGCRRQHDQGRHERLCDRFRRPGRPRAVRRLHACAGSARHADRVRTVEPDGDRGPVHRRPRAVPVRRARDGSGGAGGGRRRARGAPAVPRHRRHHDGRGQAGIRQGRRHADGVRDPRNGAAVAAARDRADPRRHAAGAGGAGRHADGDDRHRTLRRDLDDDGRRRLGQRQEIHRGQPLRRQGFRCAQGRRHGRHGRRPVQGHGRAGRESAHQDHQHRGAAARAVAAGGRLAGRVGAAGAVRQARGDGACGRQAGSAAERLAERAFQRRPVRVAPVAHAVDVEGRGARRAVVVGALGICLHARAVAAFQHRRAEAFDVEIDAFRQHGEVLLVEDLALPLVQRVVHVPEPVLAAGRLGRFRRQLGQRMQVRERQVAVHEADAAELPVQLAQREVGAGAVGALEVSVFDDRQRGVRRAAYVFVVSDLVNSFHAGLLVASRRHHAMAGRIV
ncbi:hypothetical protein Lal_00015014 [Lupinus albus]|nr:hypothetical protein Lal_00015014 [Lupinus albus]